jgi:hypothetical protein
LNNLVERGTYISYPSSTIQLPYNIVPGLYPGHYVVFT